MYEEFKNNGVTLNCETMPNGEKRYRMYFQDGSGYIRTESSTNGGWQNSHYHTSICEVYIVQKGWMILAEEKLGSDSANFSFLKEGEACFTKPMVSHNVFLPENSIIHTVKYGEIKENDWIPYTKLDEKTKTILEKELLEQYNTRGKVW